MSNTANQPDISSRLSSLSMYQIRPNARYLNGLVKSSSQAVGGFGTPRSTTGGEAARNGSMGSPTMSGENTRKAIVECLDLEPLPYEDHPVNLTLDWWGLDTSIYCGHTASFETASVGSPASPTTTTFALQDILVEIQITSCN